MGSQWVDFNLQQTLFRSLCLYAMGDVPMPRNWGASQQFGLGEAPGGGAVGQNLWKKKYNPSHPLTPEEDVRRLQTGADAVKPPATVIYFLVPFSKEDQIHVDWHYRECTFVTLNY
ncbi:hypothetical protein CDAR_67641 [Caerostris darwini]|uniref:Uncharacterized protein n=1 Tax=Caerostris darwini TaxID=1538125 RepID=A0AAV4ND46_9ARAC|nr:hypothetical protein CDAR_67641 [Caerostris darwini]